MIFCFVLSHFILIILPILKTSCLILALKYTSVSFLFASSNVHIQLCMYVCIKMYTSVYIYPHQPLSFHDADKLFRIYFLLFSHLFYVDSARFMRFGSDMHNLGENVCQEYTNTYICTHKEIYCRCELRTYTNTLRCKQWEIYFKLNCYAGTPLQSRRK